MGKRYELLAAMISLLATTVVWQLGDDDVIPTDNFMQKLMVGVLLVASVFLLKRALLGKREEGVHL